MLSADNYKCVDINRKSLFESYPQHTWEMFIFPGPGASTLNLLNASRIFLK